MPNSLRSTLGAPSPARPGQLFRKRFAEDKLALASLVFIALLILVAIFAPVVVNIFGAPDPDFRDTSALDPLFSTPTGPSSDHLFGVDQLGRDVFSRTVYGSRVSLTSPSPPPSSPTLAGVVLGLIAGYFRGWADTIDLPLRRRAAGDPVPAAGDRARRRLHAGADRGSGSAGCLGGLIKPGIGW